MFVFRVVTPKIVLLLHDWEAPTAQEWSSVMEHVKDEMRAIAITDGGAPTRDQQLQLKRILAGGSAPTAVVTDMMRARFIISIIALFNSEIKAFSSAQWRDALEWATPDEEGRRAIERTLRELVRKHSDHFRLAEKIAGPSAEPTLRL